MKSRAFKITNSTLYIILLRGNYSKETGIRVVIIFIKKKKIAVMFYKFYKWEVKKKKNLSLRLWERGYPSYTVLSEKRIMYSFI